MKPTKCIKKSTKCVLSILLAMLLIAVSMPYAFATDFAPNVSQKRVLIDAAPVEGEYAWGEMVIFNVDVTNNAGAALKDIRVTAAAHKSAYFTAVYPDVVTINELKAGEKKTVEFQFQSIVPNAIQKYLILPIYALFDFLTPLVFTETEYDQIVQAKVGTFRYRFGFNVIGESITLGEAENVMIDAGDDDADQLVNYLEDYFGTGRYNPDTDTDTLTDYQEIMILGTDPLKKDTDGNGITDDQEDPDEDGLSNAQELANNGNPFEKDTDYDGLNDAEELVYGTKIDVADTDEDGLKDGEEIALGLDPLNKYSDGVTLDSLRRFKQDLPESCIAEELRRKENLCVPALSGETAGLLENQAGIDVCDSEAFEDNVAIVGMPIEISASAEHPMTLSFALDKILAEKGTEFAKKLIICKLDDDGFTPLDTDNDIKDAQLSTEISAGGIYCVMDSEELLGMLGICIDDSLLNAAGAPSARSLAKAAKASKSEDDPDDEDDPIFGMASADVMFVVDATGSMYDYINSVANNINSFVTQLANEYDTNARFGLVTYRDIEEGEATQNYGWFSNVNLFKSVINGLSADGGGDWEETAIDGLETARRSGFRKEAGKFIILVTDAPYKTANHYGISSLNEMADLLAADGIVTCVASNSSYSVLCTRTGGIQLGLGSSFSSILSIIAEKIGDLVNTGYWARLNTYQNIKLDSEDGDTDGDGLSDREELGELEKKDLTPYLEKVFEAKDVPFDLYKGKRAVYVYNYTSHPLKVDSDGDGYTDGDGIYKDGIRIKETKKDPNPLEWNISDRDMLLCSNMAYGNLKEGSKVEKIHYFMENGVSLSDELIGWKVLKTRSNITGFSGTAFKIDKKIVVAFRGTEATNGFINDLLLADIIGIGSGLCTQTPSAQRFINDVITENPDCEIYITGHSLGGYLAQLASVKMVQSGKGNMLKNTVVFNSPNQGFFTNIATVFVPLIIDGSILSGIALTHYYIQGDIVSKIGNKFGSVIEMKYCGNDAVVSLMNHDLVNAAFGPHFLAAFYLSEDFPRYFTLYNRK